MKTVREKYVSRSRSSLAGAAVALCLGLAAGSTPADGYWISGPSTLAVGQAAAFAGGGYAPGTVVTLRITPPTGQSYERAIAVGADGQLAQEVVLGIDGIHAIEVLDVQGKVLATANLAVTR